MENKEVKQLFKDVMKNEVAPLLIGLRNEIAEATNINKELFGNMSKTLNQRGLSVIEFVEYFKGKDGETPKKGVDYLTVAEQTAWQKEILAAATPKKGVHYFTTADVNSFRKAVTPKKGTDYFDGKTPIKGTDYFTDADIQEFLAKATPQKGIHYKDGAPGAPGAKGADGTKISAEDIRNKLEGLKGSARLSIDAIKGWKEQINNHLNEKGLGAQPPSAIGGSGGTGGGSSTPGATAFIGLSDTPGNYTGAALKGVRVNAAATGLEFYTISAGGGTPGGADTQIQYNDGGTTFGADGGMTYNKTTQVMTLSPATLSGSSTTAGYLFQQTYNTSGVAAGYTLAYTNTASANTSRWFAITVGGAEVFSVGRVSYTIGAVRLSNVLILSTSAGQNILHGGSGGIAFYDTAGAVVWGAISAVGNQSWSPTALTAALATTALAITQTWNTTGTPSLVKLTITNTASNVASRVLDIRETTLGTLMSLTATGQMSILGNLSLNSVLAASILRIGATSQMQWNARSNMFSPADGNILFQNNASTDFGRLMFGGTTSSFPALKRSATALQVRLADDSAFAELQANILIVPNLTTNGYIRTTGGTGTLVVDPFTDWTDYTGSSTITGFTATSNAVILYRIQGKTAFLTWEIISTAGNGNGTTTTFTVPFVAKTGGLTQIAPCHILNNGTTQAVGIYRIQPGSSLMEFAITASTSNFAAWTTATTRAIRGTAIIYID